MKLTQIDSQEATVYVADNDEIIVSINANNSMIEEGDPAEFVFSTSSALPAEGLFLTLELNQIGDFYSGTSEREIHLTSVVDGNSVPIPIISTIDDTVYESHGMITATLKPNTGYTVAPAPANTATIEVKDNDTPKGISIIAATNSITEGETAEFQIRATEKLNQTRTIFLDIQQTSGEFLTSTPSHWIDLPPNQLSQTFELATIDDIITEEDGEVSVRIVDGPKYNVNPNYNLANITITDNDLPLLGIVAESDYEEGETAVYAIYATASVSKDLHVNLGWEETGDFVNLDLLPESIIIPAGETSVEFEISTEDDLVDEEDGSIVVRLLPGEDYQITKYEGTSSFVRLYDNDVLEVAVLVDEVNSVVTESSDAQAIFTISLSADSQLGVVNIPYHLKYEGDPVSAQFKATASQGNFSFSKRGEHTFVVDIEDDQEVETDGKITLVLESSPNYELVESKNEASIQVLDNDTPVGISIIALTPQVTKTATAQFQIRSNQPVVEDVLVPIRFTQTGQFLQGSNNRVIRLPAGESKGNLELFLDTGEHLELNRYNHRDS